jgi:acetoacetyl-CoA synthetase
VLGYIVEVDEVPVTTNGKKVETAVKQNISRKEVKVSSMVANTGCLRGIGDGVGFEGRREVRL